MQGKAGKKEYFWHSISADKTAEILNVNPKIGLSGKEVSDFQKRYGYNELSEKKPLSKAKIFLSQFKSPLIYILVVAGIISLFLEKWSDAIVIFAAVGINSVVGYFQEYKASIALGKLKKVLKQKAICIRAGREMEILQKYLVPGDIIVLREGYKVPADARIIKSSNLKINEAILTGEWISAYKTTDALPKNTPLADRDNMAYMGTLVEQGKGLAIVVAVGKDTEVGKISNLLEESKERKTPYQRKLSRLSTIITIAVLFVCLFILIEGLFSGRNFVEMFLIAVAIAVSAVPEGLPVAMTVILALGMQRILKKKGLVRKLVAAETLGSTSVICTDKTLTLTKGKMEVSDIISSNKEMAIKIAALANEAFVENIDQPEPFWKIKGRPTDKALISAALKMGFKEYVLKREFKKVNEIPFDSKNKFIAALVEDKNFSGKGNSDNGNSVGKKEIYVSGAPENIIRLSSFVQDKEEIKQVDEKTILRLKKDLENLTSKGIRAVAVAYKKLDAQKEDLDVKDIKDLIFVGYIGLKDPLRDDVKDAISSCRKAGIRTIIVTGDHLLTAKAVARELGILSENEKSSDKGAIEGKELDKISDQQLAEMLPKISVFARVEPRHKFRIVGVLQEKGEIVAMTGDGINDAPALEKADIGISLGSGTDVAKESSDLVLLNNSFSVILVAVKEGRAIIDNIRKVITYLLSDSFTETVLIGASLIAGTVLPITAVQILWVNLINDGLPSISLAFEPEEKDLMRRKPAKNNEQLLNREMKVLIFIIGLITDFFLLLLYFFLIRHSNYQISHIRSVIFAGLAIDSLFYIFSCKSLRQNIWHIDIFSNKALIVSWLLGVLALVGALYIPFLQSLLGTKALNFFDWIVVLGFGFINLFLIEATKYYFITRRKFAS